jgi:hypothetical protein
MSGNQNFELQLGQNPYSIEGLQRSRSIEEVGNLPEQLRQYYHSDDKIECVFKLDEPHLMKLLRKTFMILSWTLMLGEAAKPHVQVCTRQELNHDDFHRDILTSQEKRMILITTFIRIFSKVCSKISDSKLDTTPVSKWRQLSAAYVKEIMEEQLHEGHRKTIICGLGIIYNFCQNSAIRVFTGNERIVEYLQRLELCEEHTKEMDDRSLKLTEISDDSTAPHGQTLLEILEVVCESTYTCKKCQGKGLLSSESDSADFFKQSKYENDCSACELLILDSIFSALVYENALRRMFAALTVSVDERHRTSELKDTFHEYGLTQSLWTSAPPIRDVLFISGYRLSGNKTFERWLQRVLDSRCVRSFFIYYRKQVECHKPADQQEHYCTEPQILKYITSLKEVFDTKGITLTTCVLAVMLEQTPCSNCYHLINSKEWPQYLKGKLVGVQLYKPLSKQDTFMAKLDPIIQLRSLPPSDYHNSQDDLMHYSCVSIAPIWIWLTGKFNEYYISRQVPSGKYDISHYILYSPACYIYKVQCDRHTGSALMEGFYRIAWGQSFYSFMLYPPSGQYEIDRIEDASHLYCLKNPVQYITEHRIHVQKFGMLPPDGDYFIDPVYVQGYFMGGCYEFHPVEHVYYEFHLVPSPNHDNPESMAAYNQMNIKKRDENTVSRDKQVARKQTINVSKESTMQRSQDRVNEQDQ